MHIGDTDAEILASLEFPSLTEVRDRTSIADLFPNARKRTGIYCLALPNSVFYIGQAVDVVRRFGQHRLARAEIAGISFQGHPRRTLNERERELIHEAERRGLVLNNFVHASAYEGESDLDQVVARVDQDRWLTDPEMVNRALSGAAPAFLRPQYARCEIAFIRLRDRANFLSLRHLCSLYLRHCILVPRTTEGIFWSLSCLPSTGGRDWPRVAVFNMNWMETFVIGDPGRNSSKAWSFLVVAKSALNPRVAGSRSGWRVPKGVELLPSRYRAAGLDQIRLETFSLAAMEQLLCDPVVGQAARTLTLRVMRKGPTVYKQYHCPQLVNAVNDISF
jgi:hypothetical protein